MESDWTATLEELLARKRKDIEAHALSELRDKLAIYQTYNQNVYNILLRKSLIHEDPYKTEERIAEVSTPSIEAFIESEKQDKMSQRLASFHSQLEFLNTYYQFSLDFLSLDRIKRIVSLIRYINWGRASDSSDNIVSRTVMEFAARVKGGSDPVSSQILMDSINQLGKIAKQIEHLLGDLVAFHKELYKLTVRKQVLSRIEAKDAPVKDLIKQAKAVFSREMHGQPFYTELVQEALTEDFSSEGEKARQEVLKRLAVPEPKKEGRDERKDHKVILLQGIRYIASASFQLDDAVNKMLDNHNLYSARKVGMGERLGRLLRKIAGMSLEQTYEIEYFDVGTASKKVEKILLKSFSEDLMKKAKLFAALSNQQSTALKRLKAASDEQVFQFLSRYIGAMQLVYRRLIGFDEFFKTEVSQDRRSKVRGLRMELAAIKNSILKANQSKHEYVAAKEEEEQMKRLGIDSSGSASN